MSKANPPPFVGVRRAPVQRWSRNYLRGGEERRRFHSLATTIKPAMTVTASPGFGDGGGDDDGDGDGDGDGDDDSFDGDDGTGRCRS